MLKDLPEIIIKSMGTTFSSVPEFNKPQFCLVLKHAMARLARVLVLEYTDADQILISLVDQSNNLKIFTVLRRQDKLFYEMNLKRLLNPKNR